jgi:hypothetical protein
MLGVVTADKLEIQIQMGTILLFPFQINANENVDIYIEYSFGILHVDKNKQTQHWG